MQPRNIAIFTPTFPTLSETFVIDPVVELLKTGWDVQIFSLFQGDTSQLHPAVVEHGLMDRTTVLIGDATKQSRLRLGLRTARRLASNNRGIAWRKVFEDMTSPELRPLRAQAIMALAGFKEQASEEGLRYNVIHAHHGPSARIAQCLRDWGVLHGPLVATFHGTDVLSSLNQNPPGRYDRVFQKAEAITANSCFLTNHLIDMGAPPSKCHKIAVGVNLENIPFRERSHPEGPTQLLTVARMVECKGLTMGLHAIRDAINQGANLKYTIVGDGPLRTEIEQEIQRLGLQSHVSLTGALPWDSIKKVFSTCDIFILPGIVASDGSQETQGKVLAEAQAFGMPIITTDVGGVPESVSPEAGFIVPRSSTPSLSQALLRMLNSSERWPAMGRAGRAHVEAKFAQSTEMERIKVLYARVMKQEV